MTVLPKEGSTGVVRHLDGVVQGQAPQLHVPLDGLHHPARRAGPGGVLLRRGPGQPQGVRPDRRTTRRTATSTRRRTSRSTTASTSGPRRASSASTAAAMRASRSPSGSRPGRRSRADGVAEGRGVTAVAEELPPSPDVEEGPRDGWSRRASRRLERHPWARLTMLIGAPAAWLLVAYLGSLVALLVTSLYTIDDSDLVVEKVSLSNFQQILTEPVYRTIAFRTDRHRRLGDGHRHRCWPCRCRSSWPRWPAPAGGRLLVALVLVPLWASYLVKAYAWRAILGTPGRRARQHVRSQPGLQHPRRSSSCWPTCGCRT